MYTCKYCNKEFEKAKSIGSHSKWCKLNPNRDIPFKNVSSEKRKEINDKINKDTLSIIKRSESVAKGRIEGKYKKPTGRCTDPLKELNRRHKISTTMKLNKKSGGYRKGSGVGKSGWYKGYWCDSSWELAFVIYNIDHNIKFERNYSKFEYVFEGKVRYFYPDFILNDGSFVEIKGYSSKQWLAKKDQFNHTIQVVDVSNINKYLNYVLMKYSKNFINLYDN